MKLTPTEPDIRTIVARIDQGEIDLQPDFQRQEVWSTSKKKRLIDTVLRQWSIPPIHLVEVGDGRLEVLDGQQRLASLRDFVHNKFSIDGRITPFDERISDLHGKFYKKLDIVVRRQLEQYPIRCFKITDYSPEEPSELFYRLNQPTMLTAGEQRNALYGRPRQQLKELVARFDNLGNNRSTLGYSNLRLAYDDVIARLLFFLESGNIAIKSTETRVSERFRDPSAFSDAVIETANISIEHFSDARGYARNFRFNKASTLSWLIFFSRFVNSNNPDKSVIEEYIKSSEGAYSSHFVNEAVSVFEDRSSLRVTDVSSVIFRDFVLWYLYLFVVGEDIPDVIPKGVIWDVFNALNERDDVTFDYALEELVDIERWGSTL